MCILLNKFVKIYLNRVINSIFPRITLPIRDWHGLSSPTMWISWSYYLTYKGLTQCLDKFNNLVDKTYYLTYKGLTPNVWLICAQALWQYRGYYLTYKGLSYLKQIQLLRRERMLPPVFIKCVMSLICVLGFIEYAL